MSNFYVIRGLGGGFDGLVVEGDVPSNPLLGGIVSVMKLTDRDTVIGDRNAALSLPEGSLFIHLDYLEEIEDPGIREFASDNPFGKAIMSGQMECENIQVSYSEYERALNVTVVDLAAKKTVFSQNFLGSFSTIKQLIEVSLKHEDGPNLEDLVFKLQALKETELNG